MAEFETIDENKLGAAAEKFECKLDQSERTQLDQDLREALERDRLMVGDVSNVCQTGGLIFDDPKMLDIQRRIVWDAVKTLGWNIMAGNTVNIISVSLPVRIFEPRSFLGRLSDGWSCAPILLRKAALQTDPVERFKYVIAFAIAGLHVNIRQWKPFNPIRKLEDKNYIRKFFQSSVMLSGI
uniref:Uncharacterized protein n=1 Tax=Spongospora subterranea TaxID=70186 RepID=A0A0H5R247_9EUKA|eukprot:CRZ01929.1 hypothetical protein [Spongospora subterranea]